MNDLKIFFSILFGLVSVQTGISQEIKITFSVRNAPIIAKAQEIGIRGSVYPLSWDKTTWFEGSERTIYFSDSSQIVEFKYVIDDGMKITWESIQNRIVVLQSDTILEHAWNTEASIDIHSLSAITSKELKDDYWLIEKMVLEVHPGTYRYNDSIHIKQALYELLQKFQSPLSRGKAYLSMSKLTAQLKCDHTKVGFNNQGSIINSIIHEQDDKLPFTFKWFDKRMFVDKSIAQNPKMVHGTEILSINGVAVADIYDTLIQYVAADGGTDLNRKMKLQVDGFDFRYNAFDVFYPLAFPPEGNRFELLVGDSDQPHSTVVDGVHREDRALALHKKYPGFPQSRDDMWDFEIKDNVGILTVNSFGLTGWKAMTIDYKQFLEEVFTSLNKQKIENLIIDIRKNTGGMDEMKDELFAYLSYDRSTHHLPIREGRTRFKTFPEALKPHIMTWGNPWFYNLVPDKQDNGYFVFEENRNEPVLVKPNIFRGEVYMLVGPANTSLAFYTARDFQRFGIGKLIGEETGGNQRDINGGQILFLSLPNTGIEIDFPIMGAFSIATKPDQGVIPDYYVRKTLKDFLIGRDAQLEKVFQLILQKNE